MEHLEGYISEYLNLYKTFLALLKCEARLAGQSIYPLVLTICMIFVILLSVWFSTMILSGYYLFRVLGSFALTCSLILVVNVIILFVLMKYLSIHLKNMSFVNTREFFSNKEPNTHELTEENETRDNANNKSIKKSPTSITNA
ncbi:hypothetical protein [Legionella quateirensis]|uniref:hypothetical protein n=1 Tax=Legionella quateirensis TaxID=45072 RepID=UPI00105544B8|nr:hypothetical protein [Legionella quateirensis]